MIRSMAYENRIRHSSSVSNDKYSDEHNEQRILEKRTTCKCMFSFTCGIALFLVHSIFRFQKVSNLPDPSRFVHLPPTILKREKNVLTVSTGPDVPVVAVGLYYLPSNESKMARPRALTEHPFGFQEGFHYPIGAHYLSNVSEYAIPSDRVAYQKNTREHKHFREMYRQPHIDARFGKPESARLSNADRAVILRELFAVWYVCMYITFECGCDDFLGFLLHLARENLQKLLLTRGFTTSYCFIDERIS